VLALSLVAIVLVSVNVPPANGFKLLDHALCKEIDRNARTCKQRTSEFLVADEQAYLWFRGAFESSDVGAKYAGKVYDVTGNLLARFPPEGFVGVYQGRPVEPRVLSTGEVVGWIGINFADNVAEIDVNSTAISISFSGKVSKLRLPPSKAGEWRAEFTLDDRAVIIGRLRFVEKIITTTEHPTTVATSPTTEKATQPSALGVPTNPLLIGAVAMVAVLIGVYVCMRRKKPVPLQNWRQAKRALCQWPTRRAAVMMLMLMTTPAIRSVKSCNCELWPLTVRR